MGLGIKAHIECEFPSENAAKSAAISVSHEGKISKRSKTKVTEKGKTLSIEIESTDVIALRASMNAYLRALSVFEGVDD